MWKNKKVFHVVIHSVKSTDNLNLYLAALSPQFLNFLKRDETE